ncbi:DUF397 domain-containing protein [Streptomyces sp. NPDC056987]|uniref:DUF397 domain-containing protein n=1 Tax=Streptomyces sp. NPDC056987 TaxID=3345988 RepID=UPI00363EE1C2
MTPTPDLSRTEWVKSSYSEGNGGDCVEWAPACAASGVVPVRDSKDPNGPVLGFPVSSFTSFVTGVKTGEFRTA